MIVVLGLYRSGSSCVAGILHHLGVHMGAQFHTPPVHACPTGSFEDIELSRLCWMTYREPSTRRRVPDGVLVRHLARWLEAHLAAAELSGKPAGAKHPLLCLLTPEVEAAGSFLKVIDIARPLESSIRSLQHGRWWGATPERLEQVQRRLWARKASVLSRRDHLSVDYNALVDDPSASVERIIAYLGLSPSDAQVGRAVGFVEPRHRKF